MTAFQDGRSDIDLTNLAEEARHAREITGFEADALLVAKRGVDGVYDSDPNIHSDAVPYDQISYEDAIRKGVAVMDRSAFVLAQEHNLVMHVFDAAKTGAMAAICKGENVGTKVCDSPSTKRQAVQ